MQPTKRGRGRPRSVEKLAQDQQLKIKELEAQLDKLTVISQNHAFDELAAIAHSLKKPTKKRKIAYPKIPNPFDNNTMTDARDVAIQTISKYKNTSLAMDSAFFPPSAPAIMSPVNINQINSLLLDSQFLGSAEYSILAQNSIIARGTSCLADDITKNWIKFVGKEDIDEDKIVELEKEFERLNVKKLIHRATLVALQQGGALITAKIKGDEDEYEETAKPLPLDDSKISKGDLEYFTVVETPWYYPVLWNSTKPYLARFYEVDTYGIFGRIYHHSRVTKLMFGECPDLIKPIYLFNAPPIAQYAIPWIEKFEACYDEVINIISRLNLAVLKTNISAIPTGSNNDMVAGASLKNRIEMFNLLRNNLGTMVIGNNEEFEQVQLTLANLDKLMSQMLENIAIPFGTPVPKLFGQTLQGMNSAGVFETKVYEERIHSLQEMIRPNLTYLKQLAMLNIWGEIDDSIDFIFNPLSEPNRLEESQIALNRANEAQLYYDMGVVSAESIQARLVADQHSGWNEIEMDDVLATEPEDLELDKPSETDNDEALENQA